MNNICGLAKIISIMIWFLLTIKYMATNGVSQKEIQKLKESAPKKSCGNETEVVKSDTASEIIRIVYNNKPKENIETPIVDIYNGFANRYPIYNNDIDNLILFLENPKNQKLAQEIFSKLDLRSGNESRKFMNDFLLNSEGKNDITNFINYVIEKLKNYPYKVDFDFKILKDKEKKFDPYRVFEYERDGKKGLMVTGKDSIITNDSIYSSITYLKNGVFFGTKKEKIKGEKDKFSGDILAFNTGTIQNIGTIDNIIGVPVLDNGNLIYSTDNLDSKKKGLKVIEKNRDDTSLSITLKEGLDANYEDIKTINGINIAIKNEGVIKTIEIYDTSLTKIDEYKDIIGYEIIEQIKDKKFVKLITGSGINYFEITNEGGFNKISFLQNVKSSLSLVKLNSIFVNIKKGTPVLIEYYPNSNKLVVQNKNDEVISFSVETMIGKVSLSSCKHNIGLSDKVYPTYIINNVTYVFDKKERKLYILKGEIKASKKQLETQCIIFDTIKHNFDEVEPNI